MLLKAQLNTLLPCLCNPKNLSPDGHQSLFAHLSVEKHSFPSSMAEGAAHNSLGCSGLEGNSKHKSWENCLVGKKKRGKSIFLCPFIAICLSPALEAGLHLSQPSLSRDVCCVPIVHTYFPQELHDWSRPVAHGLG